MSEDLLSHDLKKSNKAILLERAMAMQKLLKEKSCEQVKLLSTVEQQMQWLKSCHDSIGWKRKPLT